MKSPKIFNFLCLGSIGWIASENNINTSSRHICRDSNRALPSCLRDNRSFSFVIFGVQDLVWYASFFKKFRKYFVFLNRSSTNQNRLSRGMPLFYILGNRSVLRV